MPRSDAEQRAGSIDKAMMRRCKNALDAHRRRARADGQALDYNATDLAAIAAAVSRCPYCGRPLLLPVHLAFDHAMPPSRGATATAYALANLVICCRPCNEAKGLLTEAEFRQLLNALEGWPPVARLDVLARLRAGGARRYGR